MSSRTTRRLSVALVALLALVAAACGGGRSESTGEGGADPGITDTEVKIGNSLPYSGPGSAYAVLGWGAQAYFDYVNEELGGVEMKDGNTRQINFISIDDGWEPPRTVQNVRRLVEQDQIFALMMILGTAPNMAIVDYVNEQELPHLYLATGASAWGSNLDEWPWTIGMQPAYTTEAAIYVEYAAQERPGGTVAILSQNDDFGRDWVFGIKEAIAGTDLQIVAEETYNLTDPTVDSQVANLAQSGAQVFLNTGQSKQTTQALARAQELGWDPLHIICGCASSVTSVMEPAGPAATEGVVTGQYIKDPSDPQWDTDPGMQEYKRIIEQYGEGNLNTADTFLLAGYNYAETLVHNLRTMEEPTRESLMEAVRNMDYQPSLLLPGIRLRTSPDDGFPIESLQMSRFSNGSWELFGDIVDYEGRTPVAAE